MAVSWQDRSLEELWRKLEERQIGLALGLVDAFVRYVESEERRASSEDCTGVLAALRKHTRFGDMVRVGEVLLAKGYTEPEIIRQLAQGRIEMGDFTVAIRHLKELRHRLEEDNDPAALAEHLGETIGLLGRAYKQLYIDAAPNTDERREYDWKKAVEHYEHVFTNRIGNRRWCGINYVALLNHKEMIDRANKGSRSSAAEGPAREIIKELDAQARQESIQTWDLATRAEALIALGDYPQAVEVVKEYLDQCTSPFMVNGTLRQFRQVWMLDEERPPGNQILPMMIAKMAQLGGRVDVSLTETHEKLYERVWGDTKYEPVQWMRTALQRACTVARIGTDQYVGDGTGFLFDGSWISEEFTHKKLLLTNAHVCTDRKDLQEVAPFPLDPEQVVVVFFETGKNGTDPLVMSEVKLVWTSPPWELDATLLELPSAPADVTFPPLRETIDKLAAQDRLNILGHPKGGPMSVSLQDNRLSRAVDSKYLHYFTPTDPGSSGSPIFDHEWNLVGLHHAATPTDNEGIRMDVLLDAMRKDLA